MLLDEFEKAVTIMKDIGDNPKIIEKTSYIDWPIFKKFIQSTEFKEAFIEIFNESFDVVEEKANELV